ncbi:DUF2663 family protein [Paenibacillus hexagrammi]|uniref:YpbF family protein n=1 Tax=Paenibacillus hexagrammi TaxID=2908839 RepID=A0ABY3SLW4_9BACL|nr:DUF2663 family protein [Paenibacillus sp. YPD9-1]UJF34176.1 YpbF family protein [Paenibacillus sp. YPD9-1]
MEETIYDRIDNLAVSEDTKKVLKELVERKEKADNWKKTLQALSLVNAGIVLILFLWMLKIKPDSKAQIFDMISYFGSSRASLLFIMLAVSTFFISGSVSKTHKKHKDKYDDLREETVTRLYSTWKVREESKLRDEVSDLLKKEKDINLRYVK